MSSILDRLRTETEGYVQAAMTRAAQNTAPAPRDTRNVQDYVTTMWYRWCLGDPDTPNVPVLNPGTIYTDSENKRLIFQARDNYGTATNTGNTRHLAYLLGDRGENAMILLNGDGMDVTGAMDMQGRMRDTSRRTFGVERVMLIPWQALRAADLKMDSIRPIAITDDTENTIHRYVPYPPDFDRERWLADPNIDWQSDSTGNNAQPMQEANPTISEVWEVRANSQTYRVTTVGADVHSQFVWAATLEGAGPSGWQSVSTSRITAEHLERWTKADYDQLMGGKRPEPGDSYWTERRHMLGAVVFSAVGPDNKRHRWISAFDQNENTPLYFLAQLPDKGECNTYEEALHLLAPDIVHEARAEGRIVERQGDVFFVETPLSTEQIYERAKYRVRRDVVAFNLEAQLGDIARGIIQEPLAVEGEFTEKIDCPCGCGHKRTIGCGPRARQLLSIYRTGHTATEVAILANGTTFVRGTVHHDPHHETPGRLPDHEPRQLGANPERWFLAVRNTVPRATPARPRRTAVEDSLVSNYLGAGNSTRRRVRDRRKDAERAAVEAQAQLEAQRAAEAPVEDAEPVTA